MRQIPVIDLSKAPGEKGAWDRSRLIIYMWAVTERLVVTNSWQISSRLRIAALRLFGAKIGNGVVFRPRCRVRFPWKLSVGERAWIGEDVWIHNSAPVVLGNDVVVSQGTFITTGSHAARRDMGTITRPVLVEDGAWITSRCVILGGTTVGRSSIVTPLSLVRGDVPANSIFGSPAGTVQGVRFSDGGAE